MSEQAQPPAHDFTVPPHLSDWHVPSKAWLTAKDKHFDGLASAALVFTTSSSSSSSSATGHSTSDGLSGGKGEEEKDSTAEEDRVLLIQRAPHDSMPLRWEPPGGAVDEEDTSILAGCARELREEAGLRATRVVRVVPETGEGRVFTNRTGVRIFCQFSFEVEVEIEGEGRPVVRLDPNEHVDWYWASREEVEGERRGDGKALPVTSRATRQVLLQGFDLRKNCS